MKVYLPVIRLLIILFLMVPFSSYAQSDVKVLDQYFLKALEDWNVPGMSVAIVKDGEVMFEKGYGVLEFGKKTKTDENSLYAIASNTKAFVSAALARLVYQDRISWDDKVVDYLPYFKLYDPYVTSETTIRDLLSHRVGLGTFSGDVIWYKSNYTAEEVIKHIQYVPQAYGFRAGYGYSNLMFITAGEVIKAVTGMSWDKYIKEEFFSPLHMERTITSVINLEEKGNVAIPHKTIEGKVTPIPYTNWDNMGAAGGIISSVSDMAKWMIFQMNNGINQSDTIFSPGVQVDMWTPHNNFKVSIASQKNIPSRHFRGYGLGWSISDYGGRKMVSHGGGYDGMYSRVTMIPEEQLGIVVLTNSMTGISTPISMKAIDVMLNTGDRDWSEEALSRAERSEDYRGEQIAKRKNARVHGTKPAVSMEKFTGKYFDSFYGEINVGLENEELVLDFKPAPLLKATLTHWHYNTFQINWHETHAWFSFGTVKFVLDNNNEVTGMEFDVPNYDIFFNEIHPVKK